MHKYRIECETAKGHKHRLIGYAGNMLGLPGFHFHYFYGVCSYDGHTHYYSGITGMPVRTENGHVHKMDGILELNNIHKHRFSGFTFEDVSYISSMQAVSYGR